MLFFLVCFLGVVWAEVSVEATFTIPEFSLDEAREVDIVLYHTALVVDAQVGCELREARSGAVSRVGGTATKTGFAITEEIAGGDWRGVCTVEAQKKVTGTVRVTPRAVERAEPPWSTRASTRPLTVGGGPSGKTARSGLDSAVPAIVADTLSLVAEIAYDKAKSRSYAILSEQVTGLVCEEAVLAEPLVVQWRLTGAAGDLLALTIPSGKLLPATCSAVRGLDSFVAWANNAATLTVAIERDAIDLAGGILVGMESDALSAWQKTQIQFLFRALQRVLADDIVNQTKPDLTDAQTLLYLLSKHEWMEGNGEAGPSIRWNGEAIGDSPAEKTSFANRETCLAFGLQASFAIASMCQPDHGQVTCTVTDVLTRLEDPVTGLGVPEKGVPECWRSADPGLNWQDFSELATSLYALTQPGNDRDALRAAVVVMLDIVDLILELAPDGAEGAQGDIADLLASARPFFLSFVDNDLAGAVSAGMGVVNQVFELWAEDAGDDPRGKPVRAFSRITPVVTTLASNAQNLRQARYADEETAEKLREARKESLEALIDASTRRDDRWEEWVAGFSVNVGITPLASSWGVESGPVVFSTLLTTTDETTTSIPVSLPLGISVDRYHRCRRDGKGGAGPHFMLALADIAQFLPDSTDPEQAAQDLQWSDFIMVGGQFGVAIWRPQDNINFAFDLRYAPYRQAGPYRVGLQISYLVPLFDFN
ncbi:MAG: hypothetical protein ABIO70_07810 [Pseudomonadota bacterium]